MLNPLDEKLKFIIEIEGNSICSLDLKISIQNNCFETTVYSKPTESHLWMEASSCHKKSSKNDIIKGAAFCLLRISSTMENFKMKSSEYMAYLVARGHSAKLAKSEFDRVSPIPRHEAHKKVEKSFENKIIFNFQSTMSQCVSNYQSSLAFNSEFTISP